MAVAAVAQVKPKNHFDRTLAQMARMIVWEELRPSIQANLECVTRLLGFADAAEAIYKDEKSTPTTKLRAIAVATEAINKAVSIRETTIISRCIPTVSRIDVEALIASLPMAPEDAAQLTASTDDPEQQKLQAAAVLLDAVRQAVKAGVAGRVKPLDKGEALDVG